MSIETLDIIRALTTDRSRYQITLNFNHGGLQLTFKLANST